MLMRTTNTSKSNTRFNCIGCINDTYDIMKYAHIKLQNCIAFVIDK